MCLFSVDFGSKLLWNTIGLPDDCRLISPSDQNLNIPIGATFLLRRILIRRVPCLTFKLLILNEGHCKATALCDMWHF